MSSNLTEEQRNLLINLIKERRIVYDTNDPDYKNISCKRRAWKDIANLCKAQEAACKIVWKSLRDQYRRFMRSPMNKKRQFRYLSKLSFLEGFTKHTKNNVLHCDDDRTDFFVENSSNSLNRQISYKDEPKDFQNYIHDFEENQFNISRETCYNNDESEHEEITSEPAKKFETLSGTKEDPIYCSDYFTHNVTSEVVQKVNRVDKSTDDICDTINKLLTKHFQTDEDDNDLFLKMIGKKMKLLPVTVKNRLQEHFLKEVNDEIRKLNLIP